MALVSALTAAFAFGDDAALIMGGTGIPDPSSSYVQDVNDLYLNCDPPTCTPQALATPEQFFPVVGFKTFDASVDKGLGNLDDAITGQLDEGNDVTVLGYSQSATVSSLEMRDIADGSAGAQPDADQLSFDLLGDPNNPNGGVLERFDILPGEHLTVPGLGVTFSGATPVTEYPTDIYSGEYDPIGDFPRYPVDLVSDINALFGFVFVHTQYLSYTSEQLTNDMKVPTSDGYDGATTYYVIPTDDLPLLDPLRSIPVVGPVVADLLQPDLKVLVNLGYGDPDYGWVNEDADVATPVGLFPSLSDLQQAPELLVAGAGQGIQDAISDLENPSQLFSLADNPMLDLLDNPVVLAIVSTLLDPPS